MFLSAASRAKGRIRLQSCYCNEPKRLNINAQPLFSAVLCVVGGEGGRETTDNSLEEYAYTCARTHSSVIFRIWNVATKKEDEKTSLRVATTSSHADTRAQKKGFVFFLLISKSRDDG